MYSQFRRGVCPTRNSSCLDFHRSPAVVVTAAAVVVVATACSGASEAVGGCEKGGEGRRARRETERERGLRRIAKTQFHLCGVRVVISISPPGRHDLPRLAQHQVRRLTRRLSVFRIRSSPPPRSRRVELRVLNSTLSSDRKRYFEAQPVSLVEN